MAVYEMVIRFEAESETEALGFAMDVDEVTKGENVMTPTSWAYQKCAVERVTKVVVTHMIAGGQSC